MDNREILENSARFGYVARGVVYLTIGVLAAMWAFGEGGSLSGGKGVVSRIGGLPGGTVLLALLGTGLAAYAGWRGFCAVMAPGETREDKKTLARRVGWGASALTNGFLAFSCFQGMGLSGSSGGGSSKQTYLSQLMDSGFGQALVVAVGVALIGVGLKQLYDAYTEKFVEELKTHQMSPAERKWTIRLGRTGIAARGLVFPVMGILLIQAGLNANPSKAKGVGGALREISSQSYGMILLALVALGLAAYGVYSIVSARYGRLPV